MQKYLISTAVLVAIVFLGLPALSRAQTLLDTGAATSIGVTVDGAPAGVPTSIRDRIRADYEGKIQNLQNNQEARNAIIDSRKASSTPGMPLLNKPPIKVVPVGKVLQGQTEKRALMASSTRPRNNKEDNRMDGEDNNQPRNLTAPPMPGIIGRDGMMASTSARREEIRGEMKEYRNEGRELMVSIFRNRKENAVKQLQVAVKNLVDIRTRIDSRIKKEQANGKDMSQAVSLLEVANTKITLANQAVKALMDYNPQVSTTVSASASSTMTSQAFINLDQVRSLITNAQKTIKDARGALNDVVVSIAKTLGLKLGEKTQNSEASSTQTSSTQP
ncbi:MAG: hypothetical protein WCT02_00335 [Candidatus Paceibacterota bacterium]